MTRERIVDARLHLLSRQVLDADGEPVRAVDDLELTGTDGQEARPGAEVQVGAILVGPVLFTRLFGGARLAPAAHRLVRRGSRGHRDRALRPVRPAGRQLGGTLVPQPRGGPHPRGRHDPEGDG
nr:hypothetical protein GCM10025730_19670 [Promicromonospora thailandica]